MSFAALGPSPWCKYLERDLQLYLIYEQHAFDVVRVAGNSTYGANHLDTTTFVQPLFMVTK